MEYHDFNVVNRDKIEKTGKNDCEKAKWIVNKIYRAVRRDKKRDLTRQETYRKR